MIPEIYQISIPITDIEDNTDKSYRWLLDNTQRINLENRDILEEFYHKGISKPELMYDYNCSCIWGEASGNYRFRFIIVSIGDDYVLVPFKVVDPMGKKNKNYFTISYPPISYDECDNSVSEVLNAFKSYEDIKYVVEFSSESGDYFSDNYYNFKEDFDSINKSSWRSKNGINKLSNIISISTNDEYLPGIEDEIKELIGYWNKAKGDKITGKPDIGLIRIARKNENVIPITFRYNGKLVAYTICSVGVGKYLFCDVTKSLSICSKDFLKSYLNADDATIKLIDKHLGHFVNFISNKYAFDNNYEALYYYGSGTSQVNGKMTITDKGLHEFKNSYFKHKIYYRRVPF